MARPPKDSGNVIYFLEEAGVGGDAVDLGGMGEGGGEEDSEGEDDADELHCGFGMVIEWNVWIWR